MADEVIYLAFDNPNVKAEEGVPMLACSQCRNKTFRIEVFPNCAGRVYCACCNSFIGTMGWMPNDEENDDDSA